MSDWKVTDIWIVEYSPSQKCFHVSKLKEYAENLAEREHGDWEVRESFISAQKALDYVKTEKERLGL